MSYKYTTEIYFLQATEARSPGSKYCFILIFLCYYIFWYFKCSKCVCICHHCYLLSSALPLCAPLFLICWLLSKEKKYFWNALCLHSLGYNQTESNRIHISYLRFSGQHRPCVSGIGIYVLAICGRSLSVIPPISQFYCLFLVWAFCCCCRCHFGWGAAVLTWSTSSQFYHR